jgi:thiamine kinase-like enzyme
MIGDFKSSNLFFDKSNGQVLACDWQWSGTGLGSLDVAYFLNTSASIDALSVETEEELLKFYFEKFNQNCGEIDRGYSFDMFKRHYLMGTLEYARVLISFFWKNMTLESCEAKSTYKNCGLAYRSIAHVIRMVDRMDTILRIVEEERRVKSYQ